MIGVDLLQVSAPKLTPEIAMAVAGKQEERGRLD